jgi:ACS family glucarate transporter-like MFS transporter
MRAARPAPPEAARAARAPAAPGAPAIEASAPGEAARGRWLVVAALCVLSLILYIDRVCISSAKGAIAAELGLSDDAMGMVFGSFALGYALAQIPSGLLADRFGPRLLLGVVVTGWSLFTGLTGAVHTLSTLIVVRFIFGVGEAGAFPGAARVFYSWLPASERGLANGLIFSGSRIGAALAFPLLPWMLGQWGWRWSFVILGAVGVVWAAFWLAWFRDRPPGSREEPARAAAASGAPAGPRYGEVLRSRRMLLAMGQYFCSNFTFFIGLSWMLPYLQTRFRLSAAEAGAYAMVPLLFAATSQWSSGFLVDVLYRRGARRWSRRLPAMIGFALAAVGVFAVTQVSTPAAVVACFTLAVFGADMTISPSWAYCVDLGGKGSGAVSGSMNMVGNIGSFVSANAFPILLKLTGSASAYFYAAAVLNVLGFACWARMRPPETDGGPGRI